MPVMNMLPGGSTLQIPLDAPTAFSATAGNAQVELTWTDPLDKYATPEGDISDTGDQLVSEWDHTILVRKTGSQPAGPNDGTVVVSSSVRNQYQSTAYVDSGLTNDTTYYYGVFAYNKDGVASSGAFVNATPVAGWFLRDLTEGTIIKINENGSPKEFYLAKHNYEPDLNGQGRELVVRKDIHSNRAWGNGQTNTYADNSLDSWFNGEFKGMLSPSVQTLIGTTTFRYTPAYYAEVSTLARAIFALSMTELGTSPGSSTAVNVEGSALPISSALRIAQYNGSPAAQWSRSPATSKPTNAFMVLESGGDAGWPITTASGARPAFCLPAQAKVDPNMNLIES